METRETHGSYKELLLDNRWREKRDTILSRDGNACVICGSSEELQIHHKQYHINKWTGRKFDPWDYDSKYLVTLCKCCHQKGHTLYDVPSFKRYVLKIPFFANNNQKQSLANDSKPFVTSSKLRET